MSAKDAPGDPRRAARFSRLSRVRKRAEFQRIQSGGRRVTTSHFVFVLARTPADLEGPRLGITASRKIGNAVARNRAKRVVRVAFRETRELWPAGCDVVVIVRKPLERMTAPSVIEEWRQVAAVLGRRTSEVLSQPGVPSERPRKNACPDEPRGKDS